MVSERIRKITHKTLAGFMAIWLTGVLFLLCCSEVIGKTSDAESCPLAKMSADCDKEKQASLSTLVARNSGDLCVEGCAFLSAVFDKARKLDAAEKQIAAPAKEAAFRFRLPLLANNSPSFNAFQSRVPDRHGTFIKNCVFRI